VFGRMGKGGKNRKRERELQYGLKSGKTSVAMASVRIIYPATRRRLPKARRHQGVAAKRPEKKPTQPRTRSTYKTVACHAGALGLARKRGVQEGPPRYGGYWRHCLPDPAGRTSRAKKMTPIRLSANTATTPLLRNGKS